MTSISKAVVVLFVFLSGLSSFGMVYPVGDSEIRPTRSFENGNGYVITQEFLESDNSGVYHLGVDLATYNNESGGDVRSIYHGVVSHVQIDELTTGWGTMVRIRHELPNGVVFYSQYAHMLYDSVPVFEHDQVYSGQVIGKVGTTGFSTAPHLHFEIKKVDDSGCGYFPNANCPNDSLDNYYNPLQFIEDHSVNFTPAFNYPLNFSSVEGLDFYGSAVPDFDIPAIQLTDEIQQQAGSFYYREPQYIKDGFETTAVVWISRNWADGFTFAILNQYDVVLGSPGGGLGYQNIPGCAVVEFDNWQNKVGDPEFSQDEEPGIHVGFHTMGAVEENSAGPHAVYPDLVSGETRNIPSLFDAKIHTLKIRYLPGTLSVFIDDMVSPVLEVPVDLADVLDLVDGIAWVGFTGATGSATQIQDILSWSFAVNDSALKPDLVSQVTVTPNQLHVGEIATVHATVLNNSVFDSEASQATVNFGDQTDVVDVPALIAGGNFSFDLPFGLTIEGLQKTEVIADSLGVVDESDEGNNIASLEVTVLPPKLPDLSLGWVDFFASKKGKNVNFAADVWVQNSGTKDAGTFLVTVKVLESGGLHEFRFNSLSAGSTVSVRVSEFVKKTNTVTLLITIDVEDEVVESDETNNYAEDFRGLP